MKKMFSILLLSLFASSSFGSVNSVNCNGTIKANAPDAVVVALICSDLTVGLLKEDQSQANSLNTIKRNCDHTSYSTTLAIHKDWVTDVRNKIIDPSDLAFEMKDRSELLESAARNAIQGRCPYPN